MTSANYWNKWIGNGIFNKNYLECVFRHPQSIILIAVENKQIQGLLVYCKIKYTRKYIITLLAKPYNSTIKGIGKLFITYLSYILQGNILLIIDDSEIPNYYTNLGLSKTNHYWTKWIIQEYSKDIYYKYL